MLSSFNLTNAQIALMFSPYVLLTAVPIHFLVSVKFRKAGWMMISMYAVVVAWLFLRRELWRYPEHIANPWEESWYAVAWLDSSLLPILMIWRWRDCMKFKSAQPAQSDPHHG